MSDKPYIAIVSEDQRVGVCIGGRWDGWLMHRHPDGQWISLRKLERETPEPPFVFVAKAGGRT